MARWILISSAKTRRLAYLMASHKAINKHIESTGHRRVPCWTPKVLQKATEFHKHGPALSVSSVTAKAVNITIRKFESTKHMKKQCVGTDDKLTSKIKMASA
jgi:hypothetical protein